MAISAWQCRPRHERPFEVVEAEFFLELLVSLCSRSQRALIVGANVLRSTSGGVG